MAELPDDDLAPIDVLLEEALACAPRRSRCEPAAQRQTPGRWLAAAILVGGIAAVGGVWWLRRDALGTMAAAPAASRTRATTDAGRAADSQDQKDQAAKPLAAASVDALRPLLQQIESVRVTCRYLATIEPQSVAFATDPESRTTIADPAQVEAWRTQLRQCLDHPLVLTAMSDSLELRLALADGRVLMGGAILAPTPGVFLGDVASPFAPPPALLDLLRAAHAAAETRGRAAAGEAASLEELRALPATATRVQCPCLTAELARTELPRFSRLERLAFVAQGLCQLPHGEIVAAIAACRTLRALALPAGALDAGDLGRLATLPLLEELELVDELEPDARAGFAVLGSLRSLTLRGCPATARAVLGADLRRLEELCIDGTGRAPDTGFAEQLPSLPRLRRLRLVGPACADDAVLDPLLRTRIEDLTLQSTSCSGDALARLVDLPTLRRLSLRDGELGDGEVARLGAGASLRWLDLTNTEVTATGVAELRAALPGCEVVASPGRKVFPPQATRVRKGG